MAKKNNRKTRPNFEQALLPPLLFPTKNKTEEAWMTSLKKKNKIRKIGPRLYTSVPKSEVETVVRSQWSQIISQLYPNALLSHRSALEFKPSEQNEIILTSTTNRTHHDEC